MPDSRPLRTVGIRLSRDSTWLQAAAELEGRIIARMIRFAIAGAALFALFAVLTELSTVSHDPAPSLVAFLDASTATGALAVLLTSSTLLATIAFSLATRIRDHHDRESALFVKPITSAAVIIGLVTPTITLTTALSSAPDGFNVPMTAFSLVSAGFICLMCAITTEFLELGPKLDHARAEISAAAKANQRWRARQELMRGIPGCGRATPKATTTWLTGLCLLTGGSTWIAAALSTSNQSWHANAGLGLLAALTMAISLFATHLGQVELRRGKPVDSFFMFFAAGVWILSVVLTAFDSNSPTFLTVAGCISFAATIVPLILFSRTVARVDRLSAISLRRSVASRLLHDAQISTEETRKSSEKQPSRLLSWYRRTTGTPESYWDA